MKPTAQFQKTKWLIGSTSYPSTLRHDNRLSRPWHPWKLYFLSSCKSLLFSQDFTKSQRHNRILFCIFSLLQHIRQCESAPAMDSKYSYFHIIPFTKCFRIHSWWISLLYIVKLETGCLTKAERQRGNPLFSELLSNANSSCSRITCRTLYIYFL